MTLFDELEDTDLPDGAAPDFESLLSAEFAKRLGLEDDPDDLEARLKERVEAGIPDDDDEDEDEADILDDADDPDDDDEVAPPAATEPGRLSVPVPGTDQFYDVDVDTAQRLLALAAWAEGLQPQTREAFAAIENGAAVPVSRADYERFLAWSQMDGRDDFDASGDDDPTAREVAALRAEVERMRKQPLVDQYNQTANHATDVFVQSASEYAEARGLSEAEMGEVFQFAINSGVISSMADSMRHYSPSGQLVRDADYAEVARRAFDFALVSNPQLRDRAMSGSFSGASAPDPTAIKKARAGSLASAPSAAVSTPSIDVRQMSEFDRRAAMAEELRSAMGRG
jgi:hypothetical protein